MRLINVLVQFLIFEACYNSVFGGLVQDESTEVRKDLESSRLRNLEMFKIIIEENEEDDAVTTDSVETDFDVLFTARMGGKMGGRRKPKRFRKKIDLDVSDMPSLGPTVEDAVTDTSNCNGNGIGKGGMMMMMSSGKGMGSTSNGKGKMMKGKSCKDSPTISPSPSATISPLPTAAETNKSMKMMMKKMKGKCKKSKGMGKGKGKGSGDDDDNDCEETFSPSLSPSPSTIVPTITYSPTRTFQPTTTVAPTEFDIQTSSPTSSPTIEGCVPTTGLCAGNFVDLQDELNGSSNGDTVGICPGTLIAGSFIEVANDDITICCTGSSCILQSTGDDSILFVAGANPEIKDITFRGGRTELFNGGNVAIQSAGVIKVIRSKFEDGFTTQTGGNLFISTEGQVIIVDSTFEGGIANVSGAGLSIFNASSVDISGSTFASNVAAPAGAGEGGGLYITSSPDLLGRSQTIQIKDSNFFANSAFIGGGFTMFDLGPDAVVDIQDSVFNSNFATTNGGAGAIVAQLVDTDLTLSGVTGSGNTAPNCPNILAFRQGSNEVCLPLGQPFP